MRYRRSLLASFLVIVLTALLLSTCSNNNKENKLSELEDIKLNQYMTDSGITIPESVDMDTIRSIIIELEDNPEHPAPIVGDTLIADLYEDTRNLVVEYEAGKNRFDLLSVYLDDYNKEGQNETIICFGTFILYGFVHWRLCSRRRNPSSGK